MNCAVDPTTGRFLARHGEVGTRLYRIWDAMCRRSQRKHAKRCYAGVKVCSEWSSYEAFAAWARANGYRDDLTIDRIDNLRGYEPSNCRWASYTQQNRNRRVVRFAMEDIRVIRARFAAGELQRDIADDYAVTQGQISAICTGKRWKEGA